MASPGPDLKYLGFFRAAVIEIYLFILQIYASLKDKSGSLKPGIESVESKVQSVLRPVITKVDFLPDEYLKFVDARVSTPFLPFLLVLSCSPGHDKTVPNVVEMRNLSDKYLKFVDARVSSPCLLLWVSSFLRRRCKRERVQEGLAGGVEGVEVGSLPDDHLELDGCQGKLPG